LASTVGEGLCKVSLTKIIAFIFHQEFVILIVEKASPLYHEILISCNAGRLHGSYEALEGGKIAEDFYWLCCGER